MQKRYEATVLVNIKLDIRQSTPLCIVLHNKSKKAKIQLHQRPAQHTAAAAV
jgi:hypothetical protein